jgi:hypothetical protein
VAQWRASGVYVLGLALGAIHIASLRRVLDAKGGSYGEFAAPRGVAKEAHEHLIDGPS